MIKKVIQKLNNPQFGSFGEYIFAHIAADILDYNVKKVHRDGVDFSINKINIDVGSCRRLTVKFNGKKKIPKKDAFVFFYNDCCYIDYPNTFDAKLEWIYIIELYKKWSESRVIKISSEKKISYKNEYNDIKARIELFFNVNGHGTRIIYRTISKKFGLKESPHNLLPKEKKEQFVSVYLDFNDFKRTEQNVRFIIAFLDTDYDDIPRLKNITLKSGNNYVEKIDLTQIVPNKHKCYFNSLSQLENEFFNRYSDKNPKKEQIV